MTSRRRRVILWVSVSLTVLGLLFLAVVLSGRFDPKPKKLRLVEVVGPHGTHLLEREFEWPFGVPENCTARDLREYLEKAGVVFGDDADVVVTHFHTVIVRNTEEQMDVVEQIFSAAVGSLPPSEERIERIKSFFRKIF